ncbi:hypothetical protein JKP88DRAFT_226575 [Tribonema minus]|uniref:Uncharacterized protein n=1 Tax=Tribonema minus TaxID=303371 RepID=A0A835YPF6_9STRA|nr:hypothetical protein JKP88DRAFT_226575 [Tribonema minus]
MRPTDNVAAAYPEGNGGSRAQRFLISMIGTFFTFILLRNILFKDYKGDTINYLRSTGREAEIEQIVPKTAAERRKEAVLAKLNATMTYGQQLGALAGTVADLQTQVLYLQWTLGNLTGKPVPLGPPTPDNTTLQAPEAEGSR